MSFYTSLKKIHYRGSAIAQVCGHFGFLCSTICYGFWHIKKNKETWSPWSMECLQGWGLYLTLAFPGMLMVCLEWWCFEIGTILSGTLDTFELGAQSILFQMEGITYMVPTGIGVAASIRIGQFLGSGDPQAAKTSAKTALALIS